MKIARSHFEELLSDLNVQPGTAVTVEAQIGISPSITIGFQRHYAVGARPGGGPP